MSANTRAAAAAVVGAVASEPRLAGAGASSESPLDFWSLLVSARTSDQLCRAWLGILCQWIPGVQAGLLLLHEEADRYAPSAVWPDPARDMSFMAGAAQQALVERRGVVQHEASGLAQCAYPLLGAQQAYGVVVLHVAARGDAAMREALRLLHWGAGWLVGLFDRRDLLEREARLAHSGLLQDLLLGVMAERTPADAARWVVNRLAQALPCRSALLAEAEDDHVELLGVSGSAGFDERSNLLAVAREALREAVQTQQPRQWPPANAQAAPLLAAGALADYQREAGAHTALAVPLVQQGRAQGALLVDFEQPPPPRALAFVQTLALALAPMLQLHREARRGLWMHLCDAAAASRRTLLGPRYAAWKAGGALGALALCAAALIPAPYRVSAPATVEGRVQRSAVAPVAGFVAEARARAGDMVQQGQLLARLDDRELRLEELKWSSQAELAERRLREALAKGDAVALRLLQAERDQAQAELALVRERLARLTVTAPFDGVVVKGDLSQQLGAPVEQGKVLFEVAPLESYRVVLRVDERDITRLPGTGGSGELVLAGLPGERLQLSVSRIAPVATAENGSNTFRVEAEVLGRDGHEGAAPRLQPGMEGIGKLEAGQRSLLWIALHRVGDWVRYAWWSWGL